MFSPDMTYIITDTLEVNMYNPVMSVWKFNNNYVFIILTSEKINFNLTWNFISLVILYACLFVIVHLSSFNSTLLLSIFLKLTI